MKDPGDFGIEVELGHGQTEGMVRVKLHDTQIYMTARSAVDLQRKLSLVILDWIGENVLRILREIDRLDPPPA